MMLTVFVSVAAIVGVTTTAIGGTAPTARLARVQVTTPFVNEQLQPAPLARTKVTPAGSVSLTTTPLARAGPTLVALIVYISALPSLTGSGVAVSVSARSVCTAALTVICVLLFPVSGSPRSEDTAAVLVMAPGAVGETTSVIGGAAPAARSERVHVSTPLLTEQLHPVPVALTKVVVGGSVSVSVTVYAISGPWLTTCSI